MRGSRRGTRGSGYVLKSFGHHKKSKGLVMYKSVLKHGLTEPRVIVDDFKFNMNNIGNNQEAACQWRCEPLETYPLVYDVLLASAANAAIRTVSIDQELYFENALCNLTFKNNSAHEGRLEMWICYPRRDLPKYTINGILPAILLSSPFGANPPMLLDGFTMSTQTLQTVSVLPANYVSSTPYNSSTWVSAFNIKKKCNKLLQPGQSVTYRHLMKMGYKLKKSTSGIPTANAFSDHFHLQRKNGPILLIKASGGVVHDEALAVLSYPQNNTNLNPTLGTFNIDGITQRRFTFRVPHGIPTRQIGLNNQLPANILQADEDMFVERQPEEKAQEA